MEKPQYQIGDVLAGGNLFRYIDSMAGETLDVICVHHYEVLFTYKIEPYTFSPYIPGWVTTWRRVYHVPGGHAWELTSIDFM